MRVTMDIFSGRPNPSWELTSQQNRELIDRVASEPVNAGDVRSTQLGFRGFVVDTSYDEQARRAGLPGRITVGEVAAGPTVTALSTAALPALATVAIAKNPAADADHARWLTRTAEGRVSDHLLDVVEKTLRSAPRQRTARAGVLPSIAAEDEGTEQAETIATKSLTLTTPGCKPFLTPLRLGFWNTPQVRPYNNCYNYATNSVSNTLAQPGRRSGQLYTSFDCQAVMTAAVADGCRSACDGTLRVLALAIWPGFDFHWWRLHPNGVWAQKLGTWLATNRDNQGRIIGGGLTPESSDRSPYSTFCGYYYAELGMWVI